LYKYHLPPDADMLTSIKGMPALPTTKYIALVCTENTVYLDWEHRLFTRKQWHKLRMSCSTEYKRKTESCYWNSRWTELSTHTLLLL